MIRIVRTAACLIVATFVAAVGWVWVHVPHQGMDTSTQITSTYDASVGMVDLYIRHDYRGFERLINVDPWLTGLGGDAARSVASDQEFAIQQRVFATTLLAEQSVLDLAFTDELAQTIRQLGQVDAFCNIDPDLDDRLGCMPLVS